MFGIKIVPVILMLLISAGLGFGGGFYVNRNMANTTLLQSNSVLQSDLEKIKLALPKIPEINSITGVVKSVAGDTVVIEVPPSLNPLDTFPTSREITFDSNTKIVHRGIKTPEMLLKDFKANKKVTDVFYEEVIYPQNIKTGWTITVSASENIKTKTVFNVTSIIFDETALSTSSPLVNTGATTTAISSVAPKVPATVTGGSGSTGTSQTPTSPTSITPIMKPATTTAAPPPTLFVPTATSTSSSGGIPPPPPPMP